VVISFVNNIIKYAPKSKEILINIERLNDMAIVSVIDNGLGIASDKSLTCLKGITRLIIMAANIPG